MKSNYKSSKSKEEIKRIREEYLKENFKLSLERLKKKCKYFDNGDEEFAIDMAVQLRVLLHTTFKKMETIILVHY